MIEDIELPKRDLEYECKIYLMMNSHPSNTAKEFYILRCRMSENAAERIVNNETSAEVVLKYMVKSMVASAREKGCIAWTFEREDGSYIKDNEVRLRGFK